MFPTNVEHVAFAGDWHGNRQWASLILYALPDDTEVVLHLGDFGFKFSHEYLETIDHIAIERGFIVMFVDGNHEDHTWLNEQPVDGDGVRRLRERVWHLPRGFRWEWQGVRFMALGGAHSVDCQRRTAYVDWWPEETLAAGEVIKAVYGGPVDVMITHDAPWGHYIPGLMPDEFFPAEEIASSDTHRKIMRGVVDIVEPSFIWHGHYHSRYSVDTDYGPVVTGLNCDRTSFEANIDLVNVSSIRKAIDNGRVHSRNHPDQ